MDSFQSNFFMSRVQYAQTQQIQQYSQIINQQNHNQINLSDIQEPDKAQPKNDEELKYENIDLDIPEEEGIIQKTSNIVQSNDIHKKSSGMDQK